MVPCQLCVARGACYKSVSLCVGLTSCPNLFMTHKEACQRIKYLNEYRFNHGVNVDAVVVPKDKFRETRMLTICKPSKCNDFLSLGI